jgi:hypothetical protein
MGWIGGPVGVLVILLTVQPSRRLNPLGAAFAPAKAGFATTA